MRYTFSQLLILTDEQNDKKDHDRTAYQEK